MGTPQLECSHRKYPRRRGKVLRAAPGLPWELGNNPGNCHPSAPQGEQEQPGFAGMKQNKDIPKLCPHSKAEQALGAASCKAWECPREQPCPGGLKSPRCAARGHRKHRKHFRTCPGLWADTPWQGWSPNPTGGHPKPFLFSSSKPRIHPGIQQWLHSPSNEFGITKNSKKHKCMDPP